MRKRSKNLKIMIVEDDEDMTLYSDYLSKRGYHVIVRYTKGNNINTNLETHDKDRRDPYLFLNFVDSEYLNDLALTISSLTVLVNFHTNMWSGDIIPQVI